MLEISRKMLHNAEFTNQTNRDTVDIFKNKLSSFHSTQKSTLKWWDSKLFIPEYLSIVLFIWVHWFYFAFSSRTKSNAYQLNSVPERDFEMGFWMVHTNHKFDSCSPCYLRLIQFCFLKKKKRSSRTRIASMRPRYGFMWIANEWYQSISRIFVSKTMLSKIHRTEPKKRCWKMCKMNEKIWQKECKISVVAFDPAHLFFSIRCRFRLFAHFNWQIGTLSLGARNVIDPIQACLLSHILPVYGLGKCVADKNYACYHVVKFQKLWNYRKIHT